MEVPLPDPVIQGDKGSQRNWDFVRSRLFPLTQDKLAAGSVGPEQQVMGIQAAVCTSSLSLTQAATAVPGATLNVPVAGDYAYVAVFDFDITATNPGFCVGEVNANGIGLPGLAVFQSSPTTVGRGTVVTVGTIGGSLPANATVLLRAFKEHATGTASANTAHTKFLVIGPI